MLVHDAARPLVDDEVVERVLGPLAEGFDGVVPGAPDRGHRQTRVEAASSPRPSRARASSPRRRRRRSSRRAARRVRGRPRRRDRLRVARRARRRPRRGRRRRPAAPEGDDARRTSRSSSRGSEGRRLRRRRDARRRGALVAEAGRRGGRPAARRLGGARRDHRARRGARRALGASRDRPPPGWWRDPRATRSRTSTRTRSDCLERVRALGLRVGIVGNQTRGTRGLGADARCRRTSSRPRRASASQARSRRSSSAVVELMAPSAEVAYVGDRVDNDVCPRPRPGSSPCTSGAGRGDGCSERRPKPRSAWTSSRRSRRR